MQVLFYSQMAEEAGYFSIEDVAGNLNAKLIRRHPHIFADGAASNPEEVKQVWDAIKKQERSARDTSPKLLLDEVQRHQPAVLEAAKLGQRAASVGFDWPDVHGLIAKLKEETAELQQEIDREPQDRASLESELGDLLFTAVNLARHLKLEPEFALRAANAKFRARFNSVEQAAGGAKRLQSMSPEELDTLWRQAKRTIAEEEKL